MEALVVLMVHPNKPELGDMSKTWQFTHLKYMILKSQTNAN
jgi:hypothetical protein